MIYENIYRLARKRGMSIHQLEKKAGLCGVIGRWKTEYNPSMKNLMKVADALGVSVQTLLKEAKNTSE